MQLIFGINSIMGAVGGLLFTRSWIGALIGFLIGAYFDRINKSQGTRSSGSSPFGDRGFESQRRYQSYQPQYGASNVQSEFSKSLLILSAEVMKADGKILKSELEFVKQFLVQQFGKNQAVQYLGQLKSLLNRQLNVQQTCMNIRQFLPQQQRSILVQYLFGIAQSDGNISKQELFTIERIAGFMGIPNYEFEQLKSMFWKDAGNAYKVLGVSSSATDQEIKKAYRKMAVENHPDKVASLGEQHQKAAKEKFQKIQEAYEIIRKERGF